jgi:hypothetical protein
MLRHNRDAMGNSNTSNEGLSRWVWAKSFEFSNQSCVISEHKSSHMSAFAEYDIPWTQSRKVPQTLFEMTQRHPSPCNRYPRSGNLQPPKLETNDWQNHDKCLPHGPEPPQHGAREDQVWTGAGTLVRTTCSFAWSLYDAPGYWADLEGPQIYHLSFYPFAVGPQNTKCPRMGLRIGLRG